MLKSLAVQKERCAQNVVSHAQSFLSLVSTSSLFRLSVHVPFPLRSEPTSKKSTRDTIKNQSSESTRDTNSQGKSDIFPPLSRRSATMGRKYSEDSERGWPFPRVSGARQPDKCGPQSKTARVHPSSNPETTVSRALKATGGSSATLLRKVEVETDKRMHSGGQETAIPPSVHRTWSFSAGLRVGRFGLEEAISKCEAMLKSTEETTGSAQRQSPTASL